MPIDYSGIDPNQTEVAAEKEELVVKPKVESVVTTKVKKQKKGLLERLVVGMLGPDGIPSITSYLNQEIVIPAVKNIIVDSITSGINMVMFGHGNERPGHNNHYPPQKTNYAQSYKPKTNYGQASTARQSAPVSVRTRNQAIDEYIIDNRHEAVFVLEQLHEHLDRYNAVSVADYYDMIGVDSEYTDNTYGWLELSRAAIVPTRGGYIIKLPAPVVI